jgi:hypothetical protein
LDAALFVRQSAGGARGRVSLDGYPQNEYWGGEGDNLDLAQVLRVDSYSDGYLQGYEKESVSADDKVTLCVDGQAFLEQCDPETCGEGVNQVKLRFQGEPVRWQWERADEEKFSILYVDLDIDSENHWGSDYFTTAFRTATADMIEDQIGKDKSKVVFVNDIDKDADEVPDFMDGWNCPLSQIVALEREISGKRGANTKEQFVPMILELGIPASLASAVRVMFVYPESHPDTLALQSDTWYVTQADGSIYSYTPATWVASDQGKVRIWNKDGSTTRNVADDYVERNKTYTLSDLGMVLGTPKTFYVEGINASQNWSDIRIQARVSVDGGSTWIFEDAVRCTSIKCNYTMEVVTQFYRTTSLWPPSSFGDRIRFTPDYTSPSTRINSLWDAEKATQIYFGIPGNSVDVWWHEGDAVLGHGFATFQYEGPDLGTDLSTECAGSAYNHKYFFGKTGRGAFTFWDYYPTGYTNAQSDLAWWDVCEYQLEGDERLVFRRTYTLHYDRLSDLFDTFNDLPYPGYTSRYDNFGLHINPANKGWGCLSNVGLAMEDHNIDDARMANCRVTLNMPTTANKSVWRVVMGTYNAFGATSSVFEAVFDVVKDHCSGVAWGATVPNSGTGNLGGDLLDILDGEELVNEYGSIWNIVDETSFGLNMDTDTLDYFDPGRVPVEFGEHPEDVFDVQE